MSTPSVTILKNLVLNWETDQMEEETIATFYRHYDGYPSCHAVVPWRRRETLVRRGTVLLVCYNAGYQVGKLTGLPSRRKGIMSMARYHYTRENENGVVLYLESEPAEDAMDEFDDEIAVGFSGNGYLSFWTRCRRAAEALPNGLKYAAGGRCVITDTFTGEEKIWRVGL